MTSRKSWIVNVQQLDKDSEWFLDQLLPKMGEYNCSKNLIWYSYLPNLEPQTEKNRSFNHQLENKEKQDIIIEHKHTKC